MSTSTTLHQPSVRHYILIWAWLAGLMLLGVLVSYLPLPKAANVSVILGLSTIKATLVALFYMHLKSERFAPVWLVVIFPFFLIALAFLVVLPGIAFGASPPDQPWADPAGAARELEITYAAQVGPFPDGAADAEIWVPLATTRDGQQILERDIACPVPYAIGADPVYGNEMMHVPLAAPLPERLPIEVRYRAVIDGAGRPQAEPREALAQYLKPTRFMLVTREVEQQARQVAASSRPSVRDRARGIFDHVVRVMVYDKATPGWGQGDTLRACRIGRGNCTDFHSLFIPMAHAMGIPARFKIGLQVPPEASGAIGGYHCWAEFYEPGTGWVPIDASEAWKHPGEQASYFGRFDPSKFLVSVGRDIPLAPRQQGEPVNIFFYPYVEIAGRPFEERQMRFSFVDVRVTQAARQEDVERRAQ